MGKKRLEEEEEEEEKRGMQTKARAAGVFLLFRMTPRGGGDKASTVVCLEKKSGYRTTVDK